MDGVRKSALSHHVPTAADLLQSAHGFEHPGSPTEPEPITIASIPTELLLYIFSFLNINERLSAAGVCRTWRYLIFSSPRLWGKKQLKLKCNRLSHQSRRSCFYAKRLGHFLRKVTINCEHTGNHQCKYMAVCFRKLIKNLKSKNPALTSFKVIDLRLGGASPVVIAKICTLLSRLLESLANLKSFQMSSAQWPPEEGKMVMNTLLTVSKNTLETLQIDGYFVPRYTPVEPGQFTGDIATLTRLTKLAIDYFYMDGDSVVALADARRGQMKKLKLLASDISPNTQYISKLAWTYLTTACPAMRVEFCIKGFVISPSRSIPLILEPVLRISMIRLSIGGQFTFIDTPRLNMAAVFHHIMVHFKKRLARFEMDIDNYNDFIDAAFIKMVKKCKHLIHLKVIAFFQNEETDNIVTEIVQTRRIKQEGAAGKAPRDLSTPFGAFNEDATAVVNCGGKNHSSGTKVKKKKKKPKKAPKTSVSPSASRCSTDGDSPRDKKPVSKVKDKCKKGKPKKGVAN
ncbi:unnamed protein product [Candidula unifasciata]|uniref:F-box domain-containing protein n=1 Tax=Candidula unifasciata TaxID=100452 RepID=A0A8S4A085_9EUPU|nr:unnamed protein product [Candidula unifasciata]